MAQYTMIKLKAVFHDSIVFITLVVTPRCLTHPWPFYMVSVNLSVRCSNALIDHRCN